jgi:hypothetical protein
MDRCSLAAPDRRAPDSHNPDFAAAQTTKRDGFDIALLPGICA